MFSKEISSDLTRLKNSEISCESEWKKFEFKVFVWYLNQVKSWKNKNILDLFGLYEIQVNKWVKEKIWICWWSNLDMLQPRKKFVFPRKKISAVVSRTSHFIKCEIVCSRKMHKYLYKKQNTKMQLCEAHD